MWCVPRVRPISQQRKTLLCWERKFMHMEHNRKSKWKVLQRRLWQHLSESDSISWDDELQKVRWMSRSQNRSGGRVLRVKIGKIKEKQRANMNKLDEKVTDEEKDTSVWCFHYRWEKDRAAGERLEWQNEDALIFISDSVPTNHSPLADIEMMI